MAGFVSVGGIVYGGSTNQVGTFNGQNMQNGWDANSPNLSLNGTMLGQMEAQWNGFALFTNGMVIGQPLIDSDVKNNASPLAEGP